jgi:hypothetical protein
VRRARCSQLPTSASPALSPDSSGRRVVAEIVLVCLRSNSSIRVSPAATAHAKLRYGHQSAC